jgi:ribosomal protein S18 acetylase RimI-like enzyme
VCSDRLLREMASIKWIRFNPPSSSGNMNESSIRIATPEDAPSLVVVMREFYGQFEDLHFDEDQSSAALKSLLANPGFGHVWLISVLDTAVGYLAVTYGFSLEFKGRVAWIDEFFISEHFRGRGLGTRALELAEESCRAEGVRAMFLEVDKVNPDAGRLYRGLGFAERSQYQTYVRVLGIADRR